MAERREPFIRLLAGDALIITLALLMAVLPLILGAMGAKGRPEVEVSVNGEVIYRAPLGDDAEVRAGEGNMVSVLNGEVSMASANCPDGLCLRMRAKRPGESVVCLPNGVSARIIGGELDDVAY